jgi:hypothetical protein
MFKDDKLLAQQKKILEIRQALVAHSDGDPAKLGQIDAQAWDDLKRLATGGLRPVLVRRNHDVWFAAYDVLEVGRGGRRILIKTDTWKLIRVKRSARLIELEPHELRDFEKLVAAQQHYWSELERVVKLVFVNPNRKPKRSKKREQEVAV